jgi:hypothetical protein
MFPFRKFTGFLDPKTREFAAAQLARLALYFFHFYEPKFMLWNII